METWHQVVKKWIGGTWRCWGTEDFGNKKGWIIPDVSAESPLSSKDVERERFFWKGHKFRMSFWILIHFGLQSGAAFWQSRRFRLLSVQTPFTRQASTGGDQLSNKFNIIVLSFSEPGVKELGLSDSRRRSLVCTLK